MNRSTDDARTEDPFEVNGNAYDAEEMKCISVFGLLCTFAAIAMNDAVFEKKFFFHTMIMRKRSVCFCTFRKIRRRACKRRLYNWTKKGYQSTARFRDICAERWKQVWKARASETAIDDVLCRAFDPFLELPFRPKVCIEKSTNFSKR